MSSHKSRAEMFPPHWPDSDELAATLAKLSLNTKSKTITEDKSQPPTPDNTGSPANFQIIAPGLYRSSYPHHVHFERLADLELKTIVTLVPDRKSTRLNSSHSGESRMPSSA